jgi:putative endonuclease
VDGYATGDNDSLPRATRRHPRHVMSEPPCSLASMTTLTRVQLGAMGEALAVDHLTKMGLRILNRNWRCRYGELDVIASDKSAELHRMQHCDEVENDLGCWWARVRGFRVTIGELP